MSAMESNVGQGGAIHELYGLRIRSEILLGEPVVGGEGAVDLTIRLGGGLEGDVARPEGKVLAEVELAEGRGYVFVRDSGGYRLRFHGTCEFRFNPDLSECETVLEEGREPEVAAWLLKASVPALLLGLRGEPVLHASAFEVEGRAIAVAGESGMGKSTVAALFCAAGRRLVADDLLRLGFVAGEVLCFPGGSSLRLRDSPGGPAGLFGRDRVSRAVDGRLVAACDPVEGVTPLAAVIAPKREAGRTSVGARRLSKAEAAFCLNAWPRVVGWQIEEPRRAHFENVAGLVRQIPVVEVSMPEGPPFPKGLPDEILRALWGAID